MIYQICDVMMSISTCVGASLDIFQPQLITHQTWPIDRYKQQEQ